MFSAFEREYQLPVTYLLTPAVSCPGCLSRIEKEEDEVVCVKEILPPHQYLLHELSGQKEDRMYKRDRFAILM